MESSTATVYESTLTRKRKPSSKINEGDKKLQHQSPKITSRLSLREGPSSQATLNIAPLIPSESSAPAKLSKIATPMKTFSFGGTDGQTNRRPSESEPNTIALKPYVFPRNAIGRTGKPKNVFSPLLGLNGNIDPGTGLVQLRYLRIEAIQNMETKIDRLKLTVSNSADLNSQNHLDAGFLLQHQSSNKSVSCQLTFGKQESLLTPAFPGEPKQISNPSTISLKPNDKSRLQVINLQDPVIIRLKKQSVPNIQTARRDSKVLEQTPRSNRLLFKRDLSTSLEKCKGDIDSAICIPDLSKQTLPNRSSRDSLKLLISSHRPTRSLHFPTSQT